MVLNAARVTLNTDCSYGTPAKKEIANQSPRPPPLKSVLGKNRIHPCQRQTFCPIFSAKSGGASNTCVWGQPLFRWDLQHQRIQARGAVRMSEEPSSFESEQFNKRRVQRNVAASRSCVRGLGVGCPVKNRNNFLLSAAGLRELFFSNVTTVFGFTTSVIWHVHVNMKIAQTGGRTETSLVDKNEILVRLVEHTSRRNRTQTHASEQLCCVAIRENSYLC